MKKNAAKVPTAVAQAKERFRRLWAVYRRTHGEPSLPGDLAHARASFADGVTGLKRVPGVLPFMVMAKCSPDVSRYDNYHAFGLVEVGCLVWSSVMN